MPMDIATVLNDWEAIGIFDFALPFLLIFAVVFGVLSATKIFGSNKGVSLIISLAIGLMSLRFGFVQVFFSELFPRFGVAIAALLAIVILAAVFIPNEHMKGWLIGFGATGAVFGLIAVLNGFIAADWFASQWIYDNLSLVILAVGLVLIIVAMFIWNTPKSEEKIGQILPFRS